MISFARAFLAMLADFRRARGWPAALKRALGSLRVLALPGLMRRMAADGYLQRVERKRGVDGEPWDPFHFISHPGYLVQGLSWAQRFEAALYHYRFEGETFNEAMLDQVYSPEGFLLWAAEVDGHQFAMRFGLAPHGSVEGDLGLQLIADGRCLINMNFIWADGATFGRHSGPTIFITRSQTHHWPELATFRACFKQNSPPYFCLAALSGISQAWACTTCTPCITPPSCRTNRSTSRAFATPTTSSGRSSMECMSRLRHFAWRCRSNCATCPS